MVLDAYASVNVESYPACPFYLDAWQVSHKVRETPRPFGNDGHGNLVPIKTMKGTRWICSSPKCPYQITEDGEKLPKEKT